MKESEMIRLKKKMRGVIKKQCDWLSTPNVNLGGITPLEAIDEGNIEDVLCLLNSIEWGIPT